MMRYYENIIDRVTSWRVIGNIFKNLWHWMVLEGAYGPGLKRETKRLMVL
jgi:hypothetical protein